jgi:hypothetical protein
VEIVNPTPGDCPVCQQQILCKNTTTVNTKIPTFHEFDWIRSVQEKLDPKNCAECSEGQIQKAEFVCLKCARALCHKCQDVHRQEVGHVPFSFKEIDNLNTSGAFIIGVNRLFDPLNCTFHRNQELVHFCVECSQPVCRLCLQYHRDECHNLMELEDGLVVMQNYVAVNLNTIRQHKETLNAEKEKFLRSDIDRNIEYLKILPEKTTARL